ncbi:MAG: hypothetical protein DMF61_26765 [Blastocatellia bacterium AA13]|nr:MAG: hypothetical protein DMF61_26765 [Blastocatellia bacterium AA13]
MANEKDSGFKVTDRRPFNPDGSPRNQEEPAEDAASSTNAEARRDPPLKVVAPDNVVAFPSESSRKSEPSISAGTAQTQEKGLEEHDFAASQQFAEPTFVSLVNMLGVEAAMAMGLIDNPLGGGTTIDMDAARHMLDMLGMLEAKTRGNLLREEAEILDTVLTDLRMQFVTLTQKR